MSDKWISVADELPPTETTVYIYPFPEIDDVEVYAGFYRAGWDEQWNCHASQYDGVYEIPVRVTHWKPIEPPSE